MLYVQHTDPDHDTEFPDRNTEALFRGADVRRFRGIRKVACRKLDMIQAAARLTDLEVPPGNRLEKLAGNRAGQFSIRVDRQWRICFEWADGDAHNVEIVDDHD